MKSSLDDCENPNLLTKTERVVESDKGLLPDQIGWNTLFKPPASTTQFECERSALLAKATASSSRFKNRRRIVEPIQKSVFPSEPIETRKNSAWDFDEFEDSNTPMDDEVSVSLVAQDLLPSDTVSSGKNFNGIKNVRFSPICDSIPAPKSVAVPIEVESEEQTTPIVFGRCAESDLCRHMMKMLSKKCNISQRTIAEEVENGLQNGFTSSRLSNWLMYRHRKVAEYAIAYQVLGLLEKHRDKLVYMDSKSSGNLDKLHVWLESKDVKLHEEPCDDKHESTPSPTAAAAETICDAFDIPVAVYDKPSVGCTYLTWYTFGELWLLLEEVGWFWLKGKGLISFVYSRPAATPKIDTVLKDGVLDLTYFISEEKLLQFVWSKSSDRLKSKSKDKDTVLPIAQECVTPTYAMHDAKVGCTKSSKRKVDHADADAVADVCIVRKTKKSVSMIAPPDYHRYRVRPPDRQTLVESVITSTSPGPPSPNTHTLPPQVSGLFRQFQFLLTGLSATNELRFWRDRIVLLIVEHGGEILTCYPVGAQANGCNKRLLVLACPNAARHAPYLLAMAAGTLILHPMWIQHCIDRWSTERAASVETATATPEDCLVPFEKYHSVCSASAVLPFYVKPPVLHPEQGQASLIFHSVSVLNLAGSLWNDVLQCAGAALVPNKVMFLAHLTSRSSVPTPTSLDCEYIVVDTLQEYWWSECCRKSTTTLGDHDLEEETSINKDIFVELLKEQDNIGAKLVTVEWVAHCLSVGKVINPAVSLTFSLGLNSAVVADASVMARRNWFCSDQNPAYHYPTAFKCSANSGGERYLIGDIVHYFARGAATNQPMLIGQIVKAVRRKPGCPITVEVQPLEVEMVTQTRSPLSEVSKAKRNSDRVFYTISNRNMHTSLLLSLNAITGKPVVLCSKDMIFDWVRDPDAYTDANMTNVYYVADNWKY